MQGIEYGVIHRLGSSIYISINHIDKLNEREIFELATCVAKDEAFNFGRQTDIVRIYNYYFYHRAGSPKGTKILYWIYLEEKLEADGRLEMYLKKIKRLEPTGQYTTLEKGSYPIKIDCDL